MADSMKDRLDAELYSYEDQSAPITNRGNLVEYTICDGNVTDSRRQYISRMKTLDRTFIHCLHHGLSVHHAGLATAERSVAETLFRAGSLRLLAATSTLSAGVNLNVDVVIVDGVRRCQRLYTRTEYRQMGRVMVLLESTDAAPFAASVRGMESSHVTADVCADASVYLRSRESWCKALLEAVSIGIADSVTMLLRRVLDAAFYPHLLMLPPPPSSDFIMVTARSDATEPRPIDLFDVRVAEAVFTANNPLLSLLCDAFLYLIRHRFLLLTLPHETEITADVETSASLPVRLAVTELGEAAFRSGVDVEDVLALSDSLLQLNMCVDVSNAFQIVFNLTPISLQIHVDVPHAVSYLESDLSEAELQFINHKVVPLAIIYALRGGIRMESLLPSVQAMLRRLLSSLVVRDLLTYNNLERTQHVFGLTKGVLQSVQVSCKVFYHLNLRVLQSLHLDRLLQVFKVFETDVVADVSPETLRLINEGLEMRQAVILSNNGYSCVPNILAEDLVVLVSLLMDEMPWQTAYCEDDKSTMAENEYEKCIRLIDKLKRQTISKPK